MIVIDAARSPYRMRIFNRDGSEAQMCGNGLRQAAIYLKTQKLPRTNRFDLTTKAGIFETEVISTKNNTASVKASIGAPNFTREAVGLPGVRKLAFGIKLKYGKKNYIADCVSIGNPHAVILVNNFDFPWAEIGQAFGADKSFKDGVNVHFMKVDKPSQYQMKIFERGAGTTLACGSGAAACLAIGIMRGLLNTRATAIMPGGKLYQHWDFDTGRIIQTGPASIICKGEFFL
jgi:diaminopimelate epimerase